MVNKTSKHKDIVFKKPAGKSKPHDWLRGGSVEDDEWTVIGSSMKEDDVGTVNFNICLPDGTHLKDKKTLEMYEQAKAYAEIVRLHGPDMSAQVHIDRIKNLLRFMYWLRLHKIPSLACVNKMYVNKYAETMVYGYEWGLEIPHRLHTHIIKVINSNNDFPRIKRQNSKVQRKDVLRDANVTNGYTVCASIFDALENYLNNDIPFPSYKQLIKERDTAPKLITGISLGRVLLPIEEMWNFRHKIPGAEYEESPFHVGAGHKGLLLGEDVKKHKTIPHTTAFEMLGGSLKWVLDYAPAILKHYNKEINEEELVDELKALGLDANIGGYGVNKTKKKSSIDGLLNLLGTACFVVIAGLTARRIDEIEDLIAGCCDQDDQGDYWLISYVEKTMQTYDTFPSCNAVAKAIEVLELLSHKYRTETGEASIWKYLQIDTNEITKINASTYLNRLALWCDVSPVDNKEWNFSAHQFRRFFAVLYFWRYSKNDIGALAHHFRHFNLEMTRRYVTDVEFNKIWEETSDEWKQDFLRKAAEGSRSLKGAAGSRIKKEIEKIKRHLRKSVDIVMPDRVANKLLKIARRMGSSFTQHVWGTVCTCPTNNIMSKHAKCKGSKDYGPDFSNASVDKCACCAFAIEAEIFDEFAKSDINSRNNTALSCGNNSLLADLSKMQISSLQKSINSGESMPMVSESE